MTESPVKLQDQAHVSYIRRQDSDLDLDKAYDLNIQRDSSRDNNSDSSSVPRSFSGTTSPGRLFENVGDEISKPQRPRLGMRDSNINVSTLTNLNPSQTELPSQTKPTENIMTSRNPPMNIYRILVFFFWEVTSGFSDAAPGALLPYIEEQYGLTYTLVSLIWMANAVGFIFVACLSHKIQVWFGKKKSLVLGTICSIIMYSIVLSGTLFPVIVVGFFFGGIGLASVSAQANVFLSRLDKLSKYLSFCHASYGIGATVSPLMATAMVTSGIPWNYFYLIVLFLMALNTALILYAFKGADEDLAPWDHDEAKEPLLDHHEEASPVDEQGIGLVDLNHDGTPKKKTAHRQMLSEKNSDSDSVALASVKSPTTWLLAFFLLFYQGSEVSLAGWIVTFLLDYRGGPSSVGYVASGVWGGLTLGRLILTRPLHTRVGIRRGVIVISLMSIVLVALTWAIPNVLVAGVIVSIAGFFIGPNVPLMITISADLLPRKIQVVSLTIVTAFGSSGGALFPFIIGLMSQNLGPFVVLPAFIILYCAMTFLWICLPNIERRQKGQTNLTLLQRLW